MTLGAALPKVAPHEVVVTVGLKTVAAEAEETEAATEAAEAETTDICDASTTAAEEEEACRLWEYPVLTGQLLLAGCVL